MDFRLSFHVAEKYEANKDKILYDINVLATVHNI